MYSIETSTLKAHEDQNLFYKYTWNIKGVKSLKKTGSVKHPVKFCILNLNFNTATQYQLNHSKK